MAVLAAPASAGVFTFTGSIAYSGPGSTLGLPPCGPTEGLFRMFDGVGGIGVVDGASSIGAFEPVHQHCVGGPVMGVRPLTLGTFEWDFGGGDVLRGTYSGSVVGAPPVLTLTAPLLIDGGEGRFRHATGTIAATADIRPGPVFVNDWRLVGDIDTPAPGVLALFGLAVGALARLRPTR